MPASSKEIYHLSLKRVLWGIEKGDRSFMDTKEKKQRINDNFPALCIAKHCISCTWLCSVYSPVYRHSVSRGSIFHSLTVLGEMSTDNSHC